MEKILFAKFDNGIIIVCEGQLIRMDDKYVYVEFESETHEFRRMPGKLSGYGIGKAKSWRLNQDERKKYCLPDIPVYKRR